MDTSDKPKPTMYQRDALASHAPYIATIKKYWHGKGHTQVRAWAGIRSLTFYSKFDSKVITIDAVEICTNLVNGTPPVMRST